MYGVHRISTEIVKDDLSIIVSRDEDGVLYHRVLGDVVVEKQILGATKTLLICPVEPMNLPKALTSSLLVEFQKPLVVEPGYKKRIFVTFPVEIGVFTGGGKMDRPIDIFTFGKPKFTLYGDVKTGSICKYWMSDLNHRMPDVDPAYEGIIDLNISNRGKRWVEVTKAVFNAYGMKMYYDSELVSMKAKMMIQDDDYSETEFSVKPFIDGMRLSKEVYIQSKQPLKGSKFIMEGGI